MLLRINPNRMELLRLRRRLGLARRGHQLLQDKLEELARRFLALLKDIEQAKGHFQQLQRTLLRDLFYCRMVSPRDEFTQALAKVSTQFVFTAQTDRMMNVKIPRFVLTGLNTEQGYDFFQTSAQLDLVVLGAKDYLSALLRLAQLVKTLDILAQEIQRTRRRVNALAYLLIPSLEETIRYITQKLNELERAGLVRLMRVKEIVRSH